MCGIFTSKVGKEQQVIISKTQRQFLLSLPERSQVLSDAALVQESSSPRKQLSALNTLLP